MSPHGSPCVIHMARHVSPNTRFLEIREIPTISEFNEIRLGSKFSQDDSNGAIHFVIRYLEKISNFLQTISINYRFAPFLSEKFKIFTGFTIGDEIVFSSSELILVMVDIVELHVV